MKTYIALLAVLVAAGVNQAASAQHMDEHTDVIFGYVDPATPSLGIQVENDNTSDEGYHYWESEFVNNATDEPGFETELDEGFSFNPGDQVFFGVVNASANSTYGEGYVNYFDPVTGNVTADYQITVADENIPGSADLVLDGATASGGPLQLIDIAASDGYTHGHVDFDLEAGAPDGAYGILFQIHSRPAGTDGSADIVSDPIWLIINNNLSEEVYEGPALQAFGIVEAVPEPSSLVLLLAGSSCLCLRRRR
jgi:hypothetical protein